MVPIMYIRCLLAVIAYGLGVGGNDYVAISWLYVSYQWPLMSERASCEV